MSHIDTISLQPCTIVNVPIQTYDKDFTFIVNGEEIKTSRIISDLLSPIICRIHSNDPTVDVFIINTQQKGDFSRILDLVNFQDINLPSNEVEFISEVIEILGNENIKYQRANETSELTIDNVLNRIALHEHFSLFYSSLLITEIEFIASHFYELCSNHEDEFAILSNETLLKIISNDHFQLNSEDELLHFINRLYSRDRRFSVMYETVLFTNVTSDAMSEFLSAYDPNDITVASWIAVSKRLGREIVMNGDDQPETRYRVKKPIITGQLFDHSPGNEFHGIINHLINESNGNIDSKLAITSSSLYNSSYKPQNVTLFDSDDHFISQNEQDSWICFDFKDHRVVPSAVTIKTRSGGQNDYQPRSWVIEGSCDNNSWEILDKEDDSPHLHGGDIVHTFAMNRPNSKEFQYIRMRQTGPNWNGENHLVVCSFEIYGRLI
ncbi:hypothetical protein M9Y10_039443 [Tritrichomonas musculus]|uniref:F5/8 type C domain-containing protein n=1 Tax=Tritrichomonas musculus TaxID=1915356 RepID=A0ABR2KBX4_9EUKA